LDQFIVSAPLTKKIVRSFDALSGQLQSAARFVLDHPHDVALKSMRDQARAANVEPATGHGYQHIFRNVTPMMRRRG
jgi:hypothetical protein